MIAEDKSTDGTRQILAGYEDRYPGIVRVIARPQNIGFKKNFDSALTQCKSDYVALLDGDDYWLTTDKLQKQIDFLDNLPDHSACAHNTRIVDLRNPEADSLFLAVGKTRSFDTEDLISKYLFHTSSIVFRGSCIQHLPQWYFDFQGVDWILLILLSLQGWFGYLDEVMSVYQLHSAGEWTRRPYFQRYTELVQFYQEIFVKLPFRFHRVIFSSLCSYFSEAANVFLSNAYEASHHQRSLTKKSREFLESLLNQVYLPEFSRCTLRRRYLASYFSALGFLYLGDNDRTLERKYLLRSIPYSLYILKNKRFWSGLQKFN